jgi:hypothetical protein
VHERTNTHWALLNTTVIGSDSHRSRFGAMTNARFALVILVATSTRPSRNSCKKLMTNSTMRRLAASASFVNAIQSLYTSEDMSGSTSLCSQGLNTNASTCGTSTPQACKICGRDAS